ncbi:hypothetical protein Tco_0924991 [Tanacetum coccineum]|uniref:Uncharacterized protein n=1 Tax=Tanacetum coccineum TaxID=301880 RepID=A0ABQ5D6I0_9ASTR
MGASKAPPKTLSLLELHHDPTKSEKLLLKGHMTTSVQPEVGANDPVTGWINGTKSTGDYIFTRLVTAEECEDKCMGLLMESLMMTRCSRLDTNVDNAKELKWQRIRDKLGRRMSDDLENEVMLPMLICSMLIKGPTLLPSQSTTYAALDGSVNCGSGEEHSSSESASEQL